eukprot:162251-Pleurochrysis_carterae.AAC.1
MHPEFGVPFRPVPTPWLISKEDSVLRQGERARLAASGKGATMSLTGSIVSSVRRARESGELCNYAAGSGSEFTILVMLAGDGYRQGLSKAVRIGIALLTTTGLNQSPHDWSDFCLYAGDESYSTIVAYLQPLSDEINVINAVGRVTDPSTGD